MSYFLYNTPRPRPPYQCAYRVLFIHRIIYMTILPTKTTRPRFIKIPHHVYTREPSIKNYPEMSRIMRNELHLQSI